MTITQMMVSLSNRLQKHPMINLRAVKAVFWSLSGTRRRSAIMVCRNADSVPYCSSSSSVPRKSVAAIRLSVGMSALQPHCLQNTVR